MTPNIHIDGSGSFSGGEYNQVSVDGLGRCTEPFTCQTLTVDGSLSTAAVTADALQIDGRLKTEGDLIARETDIDGLVLVSGSMRTESLDVDGSLTVDGDLCAGPTRVDGHLKCRGAMTAADFECDGMVSLENGISAASIDVDGILTVTGNIEAEHIESDGKISSTAQISADTIRLCGMVKADEIVGDSIEICIEICHKSPVGIAARFLNSLFDSNLRDGTRNATLIEATTIRLEDVCAGVVSGEHVTIGPNCRIDRLDCTGDFTIDPSSTVRLLNGEPYMPPAP